MAWPGILSDFTNDAGFPADRHPYFCTNNPTDTITDANHRPAKTYVNRVSWVDSYAHLPGS